MKIYQSILGKLYTDDTVNYPEYKVKSTSQSDATKYEQAKRRTYHANIIRMHRRDFILNNIGPMTEKYESYIVDIGNYRGDQLHTLTKDAIIICAGLFDKKVVTYLIPSPNFLIKHFNITDKELLNKAEQNKILQNEYELTHGKI